MFRFIVYVMIILPLNLFAAPFDCLKGEVPGNLKKDYCISLRDKSAMVIAKELFSSKESYEQFDHTMQEMRVLCHEDVGEPKWTERCKIIMPHLEAVDDALNQLENVKVSIATNPVTVTPEGEVGINAESFGTGAHEILKAASQIADKKKVIGENPSPDITHDLNAERTVEGKIIVPQNKSAGDSSTIIKKICQKSMDTLAPKEQNDFFEMTYALYMDKKFAKNSSNEREIVFCFLKNEILQNLEIPGYDLKLMDLIATVPEGQNWECP